MKRIFNLNTEGSNPVDDIPVQQLLTQDMKYQVFIQLNDDYYFESDRTLLIYGSQLQQGVFDEGYIKTENLNMFSIEANYNKSENIIELFDNVKIVRDNESVTGDYAKINTLNESYKVTSKDSKKVKILLNESTE